MKKNLVIVLLLFIVFHGQAQETTIDPGAQVHNYLDSKNASVDYATGTFYYKVPVHEIKIGNFTLPITLDYAAHGVTLEDKPGVVACKWNLNTGGVVTRQLRGGIADETEPWGAANSFGATEYTPYLVNVRVADGESDIFTAVFNGRSVNFVIYYEGGPSYFSVQPLEPTKVRIECSFVGGAYISGWKITDEEGNVYIFEQGEWCCTTREGTVETNVLDHLTYRSSWYLSRVIPAGMSPIEYEYCCDVWENSSSFDTIGYQSIVSRTTVDYHYGRPITEHPYDFSEYKTRFDEELQLAFNYLSWDNTEYYNERFQDNKFYNSLNDFYMNASMDEIFPGRIMENLRTMGMLCDLRYVDQAYEGVIELLDGMIFRCKTQSPTTSTLMAITCLENAKNLVIDCREEVVQKRHKQVYQFGRQEIKTPLVKKIKYNGGELEFEYSNIADDNTSRESFMLNRIFVRDVNQDLIRSFWLLRRYRQAVLHGIYFCDKQGEAERYVGFDYYDLEPPFSLTGTILKYDGPYGGENQERLQAGWRVGVKYKTLKSIHFPGDATIELDYESNTCSLIDGFGDRETSSGPRLKEIKITDRESGTTDKIYYFYPEFGTYVNPEYTSQLFIDYPDGFQDMLDFDRLYNPGPDAYVKTGNDGIYYSRVQEYIEGKGHTEYYFVVPDTSGGVYNYWEVGNPLGTCYYGNALGLQKVIRYEYDDTSALSTRKYLLQVKPCEYFVDKRKITQQYGDDVYFEENLRPRLEPILPADQSYRIVYDYGVYLKRVTEFRFDGGNVWWGDDGLEESQYYLRESSNYTRTEYDYDLAVSPFPTRTVVTSSDGLKQVEVVKRALDFDDSADAAIPLLKAGNMVSVPLKVQSLVVGADGTERLLSEQVYEYANLGTSVNPRVLLTGVNEYMHDGVTRERENSLFGFAAALYDKTAVTYEYGEGNYFPVSVERLGDRMETRYDFTTGNAILGTSAVPANSVAARDYRRFKETGDRPAFQLLNAGSLKYKLFVLTDRAVAGTVVLSIAHGGGTLTKTFTTRANYRGPQVFDLDLTPVTGITGISLSSPVGEIVYIALVPAGSEFEATSYNADGTVYCKFDHNCRTERYEYDNGGRVVKTFDRDGNLLKENSYNVIIQ